MFVVRWCSSVLVVGFVVMRRRPPRSTRTGTLFPYTTLFRSVPAGESLRRWGIALHKALTLGIGEISTLPARTFCDEHAGAVNPGRMELHEFHVLQWQASAQHHAAAVSSARMRGRRGEIAATIAAGCQNDIM